MNACIKDLAEDFTRRMSAPYELFLDLGGCRIQVSTNEAGLRDELADYFKEFAAAEGEADIDVIALECPAPDLGLAYEIKQPDPGKTRIKEEFADLLDGRAVRKRLTGMVFLFGQGINLALGPCLSNPNQVINFINNRFLEKKLNEGCLLGHAAGIVRNGRGLSLAGFSGMGKSTLAMSCLSRSADFVSNDRILAEQNEDAVVMYGVPKQPRVNPGTLLNNPDLTGVIEPENREAFLALPPEELWKLERKYDALIDECYGPGRFVLRAPMNGLVILNWRLDSGPLVIKRTDPRKRADLLPAFMKDTGLFYLASDKGARTDRTLAAYADMLARCDLIEMSGGVDFDIAADACLEYLETGRIPGV